MSAAHDDVRRDRHGVLLRYPSHDVARPYQIEQRAHVSDQRRIALLKAERAFRTLQIIVEHSNLSDMAMVRLFDELEAIREGLEVKRTDYGMRNTHA